MSRYVLARRAPALCTWLALAACAGLGGCADGGAAYPSLASRPAERLSDTPTAPDPVPDPAPVPDPVRLAASPELAARLGGLVDQAHQAQRDFVTLSATASRLIGAAGTAPLGSEAWAVATQALSGVQAARAQTAQPLAELDRLDVEDQLRIAQLAADRDGPRPNTAAIARARADIMALVAGEDTALGKLDGRLAQ